MTREITTNVWKSSIPIIIITATLVFYFAFDELVVIKSVNALQNSAFGVAGIDAKSNLLKFAFLFLLALVSAFLCYLISKREIPISIGILDGDARKKSVIWWLILFVLTTIFSIWKPTYHSGEKLDTFHEGDFLAPAINEEFGLKPYKDFYFSQGYFQNVFISKVVFKYFGKSISNRKCAESAISILNYCTLLLLLIIISGNEAKVYYPVWLIFCLLLFSFSFTINRDIFHFATCIFALLSIGNKKILTQYLYLLLATFASIASLYYSLDRGLYSIAACIVLSISLCFKQKSIYYFPFVFVFLVLSAFAWSLITSVSILDVYQYFKYVSKYYSGIYGLPVNVESEDWKWFVIIYVANTYIIFTNWFFSIGQAKKWTMKYLVDNYQIVFIYLVSLVSAPSALTRADSEHLTYSLSLGVIISLFFLIKIIYHNLGKYNYYITYLAVVLYFLVLIGRGWLVFFEGFWNISFPQKQDSEYLDNDYKEASHFLQNEYKIGRTFYPLNSELIWFYLTNQPCKCKFQMAVFYQPIQKELIECLKTSKTYYIIMKTSHGYTHLDDIPFTKRLPEVYSFVNEHYSFYKNIGSVKIYKLNN